MPLISRKSDANKGDHGALGILGGSPGMVGAAFLCARSALFSGTGRVYVVRTSLEDGCVWDPIAPEIMVIAFMQSASKPINAWVVGPGLGTSDAVRLQLTQVLSHSQPLVIDADGLNMLADDPALGRQCARRSAPTIITPHPGEAGRLLGVSSQEVQSNRAKHAELLAKKFNALTVLKGQQTLIASPLGDLSVNQTGNVALATAGTGDVLAGLIGSLIAQGLDPVGAATAAVRIHGSAAELLSKSIGGVIGVSASELIPVIRQLINQEC